MDRCGSRINKKLNLEIRDWRSYELPFERASPSKQVLSTSSMFQGARLWAGDGRGGQSTIVTVDSTGGHHSPLFASHLFFPFFLYPHCIQCLLPWGTAYSACSPCSSLSTSLEKDPAVKSIGLKVREFARKWLNDLIYVANLAECGFPCRKIPRLPTLSHSVL